MHIHLANDTFLSRTRGCRMWRNTHGYRCSSILFYSWIPSGVSTVSTPRTLNKYEMNFVLYPCEKYILKCSTIKNYFSYVSNRNANCSWTIHAPSGSHVKLELIDGLFSDCGSDRMEFELDGKIPTLHKNNTYFP